MPQDLRVGGEQREALVDDLSIPAERSNIAVPAEAREAAVLDERGGFCTSGLHLFEMPQGDVAHAEETFSAGVALLDHRAAHIISGS